MAEIRTRTSTEIQQFAEEYMDSCREQQENPGRLPGFSCLQLTCIPIYAELCTIPKPLAELILASVADMRNIRALMTNPTHVQELANTLSNRRLHKTASQMVICFFGRAPLLSFLPYPV